MTSNEFSSAFSTAFDPASGSGSTMTAVPLPAIRAGRDAAARLMTAWCVIQRLGEAITDRATGEVTAPVTDVYDGPCKVQSYQAYERTPEGAGHTFVVQRMVLHVPVGVYRSRPGDLVTITGSTDPLMVGRAFRVAQVVPYKEHATAYRAFVDEVVG